MSKIKVTLTKGLAGKLPEKRRIVKALGLTKVGSSNIFEKNKTVEGAIKKVAFMVRVEEQ